MKPALVVSSAPPAERIRFVRYLRAETFCSLRKNSRLHLFLGGAAPQRCDIHFVLNAALAAEVADFDRERLFPQPVGVRGS